ncbi:MAG TPA: flavin reductase family protein [Methylomirabilota bacterium]|jgi:flavin reductase (DIM6/NTAB) family NADH-FMN oxidoreductase RutF|nr:flavin reductase family protein [Methylomirabilota bacterium]
MPVTPAEFRSALREFPAGVTVVTTRDREGRPCGLTASAFTSVSLEPPLVLVCIDHGATAYRAFQEYGWFAVNMLGKSQEHLSRHFASTMADKFSGIAHHEGQARLPILEDVVAALECRVLHRYEGGDHTIFVGKVEGVRVGDGSPLVYFRGGYHHLETDEGP